MLAIYLIPCTLIVFFIYLFAVYRLNRGLGFSPFLSATVGFFCFNLIGAFLIAIGFTSTEFGFLEVKYGDSLLFHTLGASFIFLCGAFLAKKIHINKFSLKEQKYLLFKQSLTVGMILFVFLGITIFFWYVSKLGKIPLMEVFSGLDGMQVAQLRDEVTSHFDGSYIVVSFGLFYLLPFSSWYFLCKAYVAGVNVCKKNLSIFIVIFFLSCFASLVNLQKAPVLIYFLMTCLVYLVISNKKLNFKNSVFFILVMFAVFCLLYKYFMGADLGAFSTFYYGILRIFGGQIYPGLAYFDYFPRIHSYLEGAGLPGVWQLVADHRFLTSSELWGYYYPNLKVLGMQGTFNTVFYMQFYAEFGYWGMYLISLFAGFMVMLISKILRAFDFPELAVPLNFLFAVQFLKLSMTDFTIAFCGTDFILLVSSIVLLLVISSIFTYSFLNNQKMRGAHE